MLSTKRSRFYQTWDGFPYKLMAFVHEGTKYAENEEKPLFDEKKNR